MIEFVMVDGMVRKLRVDFCLPLFSREVEIFLYDLRR